MRIYVANLGAYNEGEHKGDWFDLPVDKEEVYETIFDSHELDPEGNPLGDYAIHDYELPFDIEEHYNLDMLNDIYFTAENSAHFEDIISDDYDLSDVINFSNDLGYEDYVDDIISSEDVNNMVTARMGDDPYGWVGVKNLLSGIDDVDEDFYLIDGYANIQNISPDHEKTILSDVFNEIKNDVQQDYSNSIKQKQEKNMDM